VPPPHPLELAVVDPLELALVDESGGQFRTFLVDFLAIFEDFWLIFRPRAHFCNFVLYDPERGTKLLKSIAPIWDHFLTVLVFWGSPFFDVFLVPLLDGILVSFGAKVAPKRELLGIILETIWRP
jgi:hypothetical protein